MDPAVAAEDGRHSAHTAQSLLFPFGTGIVIHPQQRRKNIAVLPQQRFFQHHHHLIHVSAEDIPEQFLLVGEVHVKASPGDPGVLDDLVDGRLVVGSLGKFPGGRLQQFFLLLRRQI